MFDINKNIVTTGNLPLQHGATVVSDFGRH